jgi:hypothetical protein
MPVDTNGLRATSVHLGVLAAREPSNTEWSHLREGKRALFDAADELDRLNDEITQLRAALAAVPHAELCRLLMVRDAEPCSCAKSLHPAPVQQVTPLLSDATSVTFLGVNRLNVHGPHGRVIGLLALTGASVDLQDDGRTLHVAYEQ